MYEVIGTVREVPEGVEWRIPDFLSLRVDYYECPQIFFDTASWKLGINVLRKRGRREFEFFLGRITPRSPIHFEYSFRVKTRDRNIYREIRGTEVVNHSTAAFYSGVIRLDSERMSEWVPDGTLTVLCTLKPKQTSADAGGDCTYCKSSCHLHKTKVMRDFQELFLKKEDCDVVIKVKGREFPAHKSILKARSPVFASTFRCDMKEKATGIVDIEDCDPSSFSDFLCYLYCGAVDLSEQNVFSLFAAADKYDVQDLTAECLQFMKENLSVDTFCDTLTLALLHSETELIELATDFFTRNAPKIVLTVKWQKFLVDNPTQSNELFIKCLVSDKNSNV